MISERDRPTRILITLDEAPAFSDRREAAEVGANCTALRLSSIPFAAASPATGFGSTLAPDRRTIPHNLPKCRRDSGLRLGRFRRSGTSATRISRIASGTRVVDFQKYNLHVMNYSTPVRAV